MRFFEKTKLIKQQFLPITILSLYLWVLFTLQAISIDIGLTKIFFLMLFVISVVVSTLIIRLFYKKIDTILFERHLKSPSICGFVVGVIIFAFYVVYLLGQYPGGMSPDTLTQYTQAIEGQYSDWHPVLHTLLFFTLPLKIKNGLDFIVFCQISYFSIAIGYLTYVLAKNGFGKTGIFCWAFYLCINPFLVTYLMYPWKDLALTIFSVHILACYIEIFCSKGLWLKRKMNLIIFSAILVAGTYMRHNAILFTFPLLVLILAYILKDKKTRIFLLGTVMCFCIMVQFLYSFLEVEQADKRVIETVGLPVTIWCNVMQNNPDVLPEESREFMYSLATKESYENNYITGNFNTIKFSGNIDTNKIDELSYWEVLKYTLQCFQCAPKESLEALAKLTDIIWDIDGKFGPITPGVVENNYSIYTNHYLHAETIVNQVKVFFADGFGRIIFGSFGFMILVLLIVSLLLFVNRRKSILHIIPILVYNFGTMLLLSGDDYRFFILTTPIWIPLIFVMLKERNIFGKKANSCYAKICYESKSDSSHATIHEVSV